MIRRLVVVGFSLFGAFALSFTVLPAFAATTGAGYASGNATGPTGTLNMPAGYPSATWSTQTGDPLNTYSGSASSGPAGNTVWGAVFGSARNRPYVSYQIPLGISTGVGQSITLAFTTAMPANSWGFNLGDVDAENVSVEATTTGGASLTGTQLGFQSTYNFGGSADVPSSTVGVNSVTISGNGTDTQGAAAWFQPNIAVSTITFTTAKNTSGSPTFQIWFAAFTNVISGTVSEPANTPPVRSVDLTSPESTAVIASVQPQPDGSFSFPTVAPTQYDVVVEYSDGSFGTPVHVDASNGDVSGVALTSRQSLVSTGVDATNYMIIATVGLLAGLLVTAGRAHTARVLRLAEPAPSQSRFPARDTPAK